MQKLIISFLSYLLLTSVHAEPLSLPKFIDKYCSDCHADGADKGGLDFDKLKYDLKDAASFAKWEQIYDRVLSGEMPPPKKKKQPTKEDLQSFDNALSPNLLKAHTVAKGTVLRRLNRQEYENTLNDMFGTNLMISEMLPEDGRSHEFDNVGEALGMSMGQLQRYIDITEDVINAAVETRPEPPEINERIVNYNHKGYAKHIGKKFKKLEGDTIVRFSGHVWPDGILQSTNMKQDGFFEVEITGYGYQSEKPMIFSASAKGYAAGSPKPHFGYFSFAPNKMSTVKFTGYLHDGIMLKFEPYGINYKGPWLKPKEKFNPNTYKGPGFAVKEVKVRGPIRKEFPSRGHKLLFDGIDREPIKPKYAKDLKNPKYKYKFKINSKDPNSDASVVLNRLAQKAFRTNNPDIKPYLELFKTEVKNGEDFESALKTAVTAVLCSPDFLFMKEEPGELNDFALATRMSYFLNRSMPDDKLFELARAGKLKSAESRKSELKRLMAKPEFDRFIEDFTDAWLNLRDMDFTEPDKTLFPEYAAYLRYSMPKETQLFFKEMIKSNLSVSNIIKSDFVIINDRLAELYKIDGVVGPEFRKVKIPKDSVRGGLISQASVHKVSANGTNTSPVVRGIWILERILGISPPPPPPGISGVEPDIRGAQTLREILDKHRESPSCNSCHTKIDPLGFAMESFSPIGVYRENFRTKKGKGKKITPRTHGSWASYYEELPVDATGQFADGRKFATFNEFRNHLVEDKEQIAKTITKKLLTFATGRDMGFSDRIEIERIVKATAKNDYRLGDIFIEVINSKIFLNK